MDGTNLSKKTQGLQIGDLITRNREKWWMPVVILILIFGFNGQRQRQFVEQALTVRNGQLDIIAFGQECVDVLVV